MAKFCRFIFLNIVFSCVNVSALEYRTVAITGDNAPGIANGRFYRIGTIWIDNQGTVGFGSSTLGTGFNDEGYWSERSGSLTNIAHLEYPVDSHVADAVMDSFGSRVYSNTSGYFTFNGTIDGTGITSTNDEVIMVSNGSELSTIAYQFQSAPGIRRFSFQRFDAPRINSSSTIVFHSTLLGPGVVFGSGGNDRAFFRYDSGRLELIVRTSDLATQAGNGVRFDLLSSEALLNDNGDVYFGADLSGGNIPQGSVQGSIWRIVDDNKELLVREGNQVQGLASGITYGRAIDFSANNSGVYSFWGTIDGPGINSSNNIAVFASRNNQLIVLARNGDQAVGFDAGITYDDVRDPFVASDGRVFFESRVTGNGITTRDNYRGVWVNSVAAGTEAVILSGDTPPGFNSNFAFGTIGSIAINNEDYIVFTADLEGPGVTSTNNQSLWVIRPDTSIELLLREGDLFDVNDDPAIEDLRTIRSIRYKENYGSEVGTGIGFNDRNELAVSLEFYNDENNSGLTFGAFVLTVPEPHSITLLCTGLLIMLRRMKFG